MQDSHSASPYPWQAGSASGIGSMPGTSPAEAIAVVLGELPDLPYLPELPGRGPGADLIGRTAALLVDMPVETTTRGWRLAERRGRDLGRADGLMSADLDALEEAATGYQGAFKLQVCGPWTLAAALELTRSVESALADDGATGDLIASLAEGVAGHVAAVRRRLPGATIILQLDEPGLPGVLAGSVPSASGLYRLAPIEEQVASEGLRQVLRAAGTSALVHCCAPEVPFRCITSAGADAVSLDLGLLRRNEENAVGEASEAGIGLFLGAVPPVLAAGRGAAGRAAAGGAANGAAGGGRPGATAPSAEDAARQTAAAVIRLWRRIGLAPGSLTEQVVVTPACGLAGASPARASAVLTQCQAAARLIPELIEEGAT